MRQQRHINLLNKIAEFFEQTIGPIKSPTERALRRRLIRAQLRYARHSSYRGCGQRQRERYARNHMDEQQRNSHKPGTVQRRHIFGATSPTGWLS